MANNETLATITHIRLSERQMSDSHDNLYDVFGGHAKQIIALSDCMAEIDPDAATFLIERACQESTSGSMTLEQIIEML